MIHRMKTRSDNWQNDTATMEELERYNYWMRRLQTVHLLGGNPGDIVTRAARIDAVTPAIVQDTFKKYFPLDRYTVVTLLPESK